MTCHDIRLWLDGYLDDELDLARSLDVEQHLGECASCAVQADGLRRLRSVMAAQAPYHAAPEELRKRIRRLAAPQQRSYWQMAWIPAAAAVLAAAFLVAPRRGDPIEAQVVDNHIRSLLANHLTDVASSDRHTVKPWFTGKLDFGADVFDLTASGFPLAGGRLDYVDNRTVAALVYNRAHHVINVFLWPDSGPAHAARAGTIKGLHTIHWSAGGMTWWAVSDVNAQDLAEFSRLLIGAEEHTLH
jgi:anti-sigma factor RsiW